MSDNHLDNNNSWITLSTSFIPPFHIYDELKYLIKRISIDIIMFIPLVFFILFLFAKRTKKHPPKMLFGTHPVFTFLAMQEILSTKFDTTLFVFDDYSQGNFHNGLTLHDITPSYIKLSSPYFLGSYIAYFWALKNFNIFHLYFDAGFLERTIWWRLEPIIYQLLSKKVILYPYGTDSMPMLTNTNLSQKLGHMQFSNHYFNLDFKRIKRNYWWSKYANLIFGFAPFIQFLPRIDILLWHGQIIPNYQQITHRHIKPDQQKIKILHFANQKARKGSYFIEEILSKITMQYPHVSYECLEGVPRSVALQKLEECDIFIDSLLDGYFQFSSIDAMLMGKVTLNYYDNNVDDIFLQLNPEYFEKFFNEFPAININVHTLENELKKLLDNHQLISDLSIRSYKYAYKIIDENIHLYQDTIDKLVNP